MKTVCIIEDNPEDIFPLQLLYGFYSVQSRHGDLEDYDAKSLISGKLNHLISASRLSNLFDRAFVGNDLTETFSHYGMIICH